MRLCALRKEIALRKLAALFLAASALALSSSAQTVTEDYTTEVGVSYSYLNTDIGQHGIQFHGAYLPTPNFGIFGDLGFYGGSTDVLGLDFDANTQHYLFGPRLYFPLGERENVTPFGHLLLGGSHTSGSSTAIGVDDSDSAFTWGLGGGVDFRLAEKWAVRGQFDWLRTDFFDNNQNDPRFGFGIVYRWGDR